MFGHGEQVIWHRWVDGGYDEYGGKNPGTHVDQLLENVGFAPESTEEVTTDRRVSTEAKLIVFGSPVPYTARDQFTVRGVRYGVLGTSSGGWRNPFTGWSPGQEIQLRRVTG